MGRSRSIPLVLGLALAGPAISPLPAIAQAPPAWLTYVNRYRASGALPLLTEQPTWSNGDTLHARYTVRTDVLAHSEDPVSSEYTAEGNLAAQNSNVMASSWMGTTDEAAIDMWMTGPFHAVGMIDPHLARTGFGSFRESGSSYQMAAALDVLRGRGSLPAGWQYPAYWPAPGRSVAVTSYTGGESPDPLTSCSGYSTPTGLPLVVQLGPGYSVVPSVTATSVLEDGVPVTHCTFDETNYTNPTSSTQSLGRSVLNARDAVVIIPRNPLVASKRYTVSITTNGSTYTWTFRVGPLLGQGVRSDTDADAIADVTVYRPSTGTWFSLTSSSGRQSFTSRGWGQADDVPVVGDFDGDGVLDPTVYRPSTGTWFVLKSSSGYSSWAWWGWGSSTDTLVPADYDGDGITDAAVYRASEGRWYVRPSASGATAWNVAFGDASDIPLPGDYDGDGRADLMLFRPSTGTWFLLKSSTGYTSWSYYGWGTSTDKPAPADYDRDGKLDIAVFRPSTGTWFVLTSASGFTSWTSDGWGVSTDVPVPADFDGDGKADLAIYRPSTGQWYVKPSNGTTPWSVVFGAAGDVPLTGSR